MNKTRRDELDVAAETTEALVTMVENAAEEEREYFDSMPEGLQGSEKGDRANEVVDELEQITDELSDIASRIRECMT